MDNPVSVSEVQRGESDGEDIRPASTEELSLTDLRLWKVTSLEGVADIIQRYDELDIPKQHSAVFADQLVGRRDAWFIEAGVFGMIYLTDVIPGFNAYLHTVFWDKKLSANRREAVKSVLATAFHLFELPRVSALCASSNDPMRNMLRKVGFSLEGTIRRGWPSEPREDAIMHGMLREELPWHVLPIPASSLE